MSTRVSQMQVLRQERHPLVALTTLAFVLRLCLVILATALSPNAASAAGLTSLCQPSGQQENLAGLHDPLSCQCGPVCAHGCALGPCLVGETPAFTLKTVSASIALPRAAQDDPKSNADRIDSIRAPPQSLI
jgi:hypothetical protein